MKRNIKCFKITKVRSKTKSKVIIKSLTAKVTWYIRVHKFSQVSTAQALLFCMPGKSVAELKASRLTFGLEIEIDHY